MQPDPILYTYCADDASIPDNVWFGEDVEQGHVLDECFGGLRLLVGHHHTLGRGVGGEMASAFPHPPGVQQRDI